MTGMNGHVCNAYCVPLMCWRDPIPSEPVKAQVDSMTQTAQPTARPPIYLPSNRVLAYVPYALFVNGYEVKLLPRDHVDRRYHQDGNPFGIYLHMSGPHKDEIVLDVVADGSGKSRPLAGDASISIHRMAIVSARTAKFQDLCQKHSIVFWPNGATYGFVNFLDEVKVQVNLKPVPIDVHAFL